MPRPLERLEHALALIVGDAGAAIQNPHHHLRWCAIQLHLSRTALPVSPGVVQQIGQRPPQRQHRHAAGAMVRRLPDHLCALPAHIGYCRVEDLAQVAGLRRFRRGTASEAQMLTDQPIHALDIAFDILDQTRIDGIGEHRQR